MDRYYVNNHEQANGDHEVHKEGCSWLKLAVSTKDLGLHNSCVTAVVEAKRHYWKSNGCYYCARPCNTG